MGKGPGKRQQRILAELALHECFWLRSLLGPSCTRAEYNALLRAAIKLEDAGLILIDRWSYGSKAGIGKTAIRRIGTRMQDRDSVLSVSKVTRRYFTNT